MTEDGMQHSSHSPRELFNTLADIVTDIKLSEIAISPYVLPRLSPADPTASTSTFLFDIPSPEEIYPFTLLEQDKLVIPQKPLYAIFAYAVRSLAQEDTSFLHSTEQTGPQSVPRGAIQRLDRCTKIILLQNPEHVKALNIRKRLVLYHLAEGNDPFKELLEREAHYTSLALGIAANAKMATLWYHRRWLLSLQYGGSTHLRPSAARSSDRNITRLKNIGIALPVTVLDREIALVDRSAQRYPRNYQAWAYRSWLLSDGDVGFPILEAEFTAMSKHLSTNVTDHTAVVHVLHLLERQGREEQRKAMKDLAVELVERYPHRETPWLFLRGLVQLSGGNKKGGYAKEAQQLAERILKTTGDSSTWNKDIPDWQQAQDVKALILSRRTLFFLRAKDGNEHDFSGAEARVVLDLCRI